MTRRFAALLLVATVGTLGSAAPPPVVPWREAAAHVGETVTVEGRVASARRVDDTCVIEFAPDDPQALRAVLVIGLLTNAPAYPERRYAGRQVRVTGVVRRFAGRPEIVVRDPDLIEIVDGEPPDIPSSRSTAAPEAAPPPPAPPPHAERGLVGAVEEQVTRLRPCERAQAGWRAAAGEARERARAFIGCVDAASNRCRSESAALAAALTTLDAAERELAERCP